MMRSIMVSLIIFTPHGGFGQPAASPLAFDVASVKPNQSGDNVPSRFATSHGDITAINVTLKFLIMNAYAVRDDQISGGPNWLNFERYDIVAKQPTGERTPARSMRMLQTLLAD